MIRFGLIAEGFTDQAVVGNIVTGVHDPEAISLRQVKPVRDTTQRSTAASFSNWELVLEFISSPNFSEVFPFVDYVIVHVDTDECDHQNFGVSKRDAAGTALEPMQLIEQVKDNLIHRIGTNVWSDYSDQIIFAIAVDSIECWLLPIYATAQQKPKYVGCLNALNRALERRDRDAVNPDGKDPDYYRKISMPYSHRRDLTEHYKKNDGLRVFVERLMETVTPQ